MPHIRQFNILKLKSRGNKHTQNRKTRLHNYRGVSTLYTYTASFWNIAIQHLKPIQPNFTQSREMKQNDDPIQRKAENIPCSLRAVKIIVPVSSPTRHSAMRDGRVGRARTIDDRTPLLLTPLFTGFELITFTVSVWPLVPGLSWSTLTNTGFLFAVVAGVVAMD